MCPHTPSCPPADAPDHDAARIVADHLADCGYMLLCNGVIVFDDGGEIADGRCSGRPVLPLPRRRVAQRRPVAC